MFNHLIKNYLIMVKKFFYVIALLFVFNACSKSESMNEETMLINRFEKDERVSIIVTSYGNLINEYFLSSSKSAIDKQLFLEEMEKIKCIVNDMLEEYGEDNIMSFCDVLAKEESLRKRNAGVKGNCCQRNSDGTTNWDCCGVWTGFKAAVASALYCDQGDGYYDCVQERVCKNCN